MNRVTKILIVFVLLGHSHFAPSQRLPNIVLLTVDDMNYNSCGVMGSQVPNITPHIDQLARQGILFTRGYVSSAVCVPSRTSIMTACYPHRVSQWDGFGKPASAEKVPQAGYNIKKGTPTLTKALKQAGYVTGILAKPNHHLPEEEFPWDVVYGHHAYEELKHGRDAELYGKRTEEVIQLAKTKNKPFFLVANAGDPHRPFPGSPDEVNSVAKGRFGGAMPLPSKVYQPDEVPVPAFLPNLPDVRKEVALYYSGVKRADDIVGSVLKKLKEAGVENETIIVFLSDHGAPFPFAKECSYMNSTRTPVIVRWPGHVAPGKIDSTRLISALDVAPTLLDLLELPPMPGVDGRSFKPLLYGKEQKNRARAFTVYHFTPGHEPIQQRAVTYHQYTYVFNAFAAEKQLFTCGDPKGGLTYKAMKEAAREAPELAKRVQFFDYRTPEEMYDDQQDPDALTNLMDDQSKKKLIRDMQQMLLAWMREKEDPLLPYYVQYLHGQKQK